MKHIHAFNVASKLRELYEFMSTIIALQRDTRIPGSVSLLYLDRARRMICFYLYQWARSTNESAPDCDPFAKRVSNY